MLQSELVLIGDSQGGLVAPSLYDQYKDQLQVKGIITNHAPWEGAELAKLTEKDIAALVASFKARSQIFDSMLDFYRQQLQKTFQQLFRKYSRDPGVTDLLPGSSYLEKVKQNLPQATVPILAIVGNQVNIKNALEELLATKSVPATIIQLLDLFDFSHLDKIWS